jgi:hypothetical protein
MKGMKGVVKVGGGGGEGYIKLWIRMKEWE